MMKTSFVLLGFLSLATPALAQPGTSRPELRGNESTFKAEVTLKGDTVLQRLAVAVVCSEPIEAVRIERQDGTVVSTQRLEDFAEKGETFYASIPINSFPNGIYFVHVVCESGYVARKFEVRK